MQFEFDDIFLKPSQSLRTTLTRYSLCLDTSSTKIFLLPLKTLLGCRIPQPTKKKALFQLEIFFFKTEKKKYGKFEIDFLETRKIKTEILYSKSKSSLEKLEKGLMYNFYLNQKINFKPRFDSKDKRTYYKRALVFLNPNSGKGKAEKVFNETKIFLESNKIHLSVVKTKDNKYTSDFIQKMDKSTLLSFDLIICFSGDGIPHQILNGYLRRKDIDQGSHPLTIVLMPVGTGCALAENCMKSSSKETSITNTIFSICNFRPKKFSIAKFEYLTEKKEFGVVYGFLNLTYGFPSEVVINSERLRFLGRPRVYPCGLYELVFLKPFNAKVTYPKEVKTKLPDLQLPVEGELFESHVDPLACFFASEVPYCAVEYRGFPLLEGKEDFLSNLQVFEKDNSRSNLVKLVFGHQEHDPELGVGLVERLVGEYRLEFDREEDKKGFLIDGEIYTDLNVKTIQKKMTPFFFNSLI